MPLPRHVRLLPPGPATTTTTTTTHRRYILTAAVIFRWTLRRSRLGPARRGEFYGDYGNVSLGLGDLGHSAIARGVHPACALARCLRGRLTRSSKHRQFYANVYPNTTVKEVNVPQGICIKRFSPDGSLLLCFTDSQRAIVVFTFRWPAWRYVLHRK